MSLHKIIFNSYLFRSLFVAEFLSFAGFRLLKELVVERIAHPTNLFLRQATESTYQFQAIP